MKSKLTPLLIKIAQAPPFPEFQTAYNILTAGESKMRGYMKRRPLFGSAAVTGGMFPMVMGSGPRKVRSAYKRLSEYDVPLKKAQIDSARQAGVNLYKSMAKKYPGATTVERVARKIRIIPKEQTGEQAVGEAAVMRTRFKAAIKQGRELRRKASEKRMKLARK